MGHVKGRGLGKEEQGTADIVVQQMQLGRRGLGMKIAGFEPSDETWEFEEVYFFGEFFSLVCNLFFC